MPQLPLEILDAILDEHFLLDGHHEIPFFLHISHPFRSLAKRRIFQNVQLEYPDDRLAYYPPRKSRSNRLLDLVHSDSNIPSYIWSLSITFHPSTSIMGASFPPRLSAAEKAADQFFVQVLDRLAAEGVGLTTLRMGFPQSLTCVWDTTAPLDSLPPDILKALIEVRCCVSIKNLHLQYLSRIPWSILMGDWEGDELETLSLEMCSTQAVHWQVQGFPVSPSGLRTVNSSPGGSNVFVSKSDDSIRPISHSPHMATLSPTPRPGLGPLNVNDTLIGNPATPFMRLKRLALSKTSLGLAEFAPKSPPRQAPGTSEPRLGDGLGADALRFPSLESVSLEIDLTPVVVKNASWILERCLVLKDFSLRFSFSQQARVGFAEIVKRDEHLRQLGMLAPYTLDNLNIPSLAGVESLTLENNGPPGRDTTDFGDLLRLLEINMPFPKLQSLTVIGLLEETMFMGSNNCNWARLQAVLGQRNMPSLGRLHLGLCFRTRRDARERRAIVESVFKEWGVRFSFGGRVMVTQEVQKID